MADRVKVYEDPDTGEMIAYLPGSAEPMPITPEQLGILNESGPEAFLNSAGNSVAQLALGGGSMIAGGLGFDERAAGDRAQLDELRANQELRGGESPVAGFAGSVAPDVAVGAMTGGAGTVARRMAGTALVEGGLGAARNPEDPLIGAAVQGGLGAGLVGAGPVVGAAGRGARGIAGRARMHPFTRRVLGGIDDAIQGTRGAADDLPGIYRSAEGETGMAAAARSGPPEGQVARAGVEGAERALAPAGADISRGLTPEELTSGQMRGAGGTSADDMVDRWSFPLSKFDAQMIDAQDDATFEAARAGKLEEWQRARTGGVISQLKNGKPTDFSKLEGEQRRAMRRAVAAEIGQPQAQRLDRNTIGENLERISEDISGIIKQSGPVRTKPVIDQWQYLLDRRPNGAAANELRSWIKEMSDLPKNGANPKEVAALRNEISKAMEWAGRNEPEPRAVETMGAARDMLDAELKKNWTPDMQEQFEELGYQWKLSQALVRGAKGAIADDGELLPGQFMNNWRMMDHMVKTGRKRDDEFLQFMQTAAMVRAVRGPESGTPAGIAAMLGQRLGDAALGMVPGGNLLR